ncbi:MAG TPA: PhoPQ-activated protein PqaA family protein [Pseudomonadota bacterium]|nr:PhoPQ-activated protein PqaA family protein [Pseudomonadota bacterium]
MNTTLHTKSPASAQRALRFFSRLLPLCLLASIACGSDRTTGTQMPPDPMAEEVTALDRYINTPDPDASWKLLGTEKGSGYTTYLLEMKSGSWRKSSEVDRTLWQHHVLIVVPDNVTPGPGVLLISGGSNSGSPPSKAGGEVVTLARSVGAVAVELRQIPNQPLTFADHDGKPHSEDGIIAFGWAQVVKTGDPTWHARFPMVRAAVRAMDATQAFLNSPQGPGGAPDKFIVAGGSKRGWTTWMTAAVDKRVSGIVPIVIDVLNVSKFMRQHVESYGFWARSLYDYHYNHLTEKLGTREWEDMLKNEDPYLFRRRFTMPKYIMNATGDQFFLPDGSANYFGELPGEKYLRYVPNGDHGLDDTDAVEGAVAFVGMLREGRQRPAFSFTFEGPSSIRVTTGEAPQKVLLWQAENPKARDFRVETLGKVWKSSELSSQGGGVYVGKIDPPTQGYRAFLIEVHFASGQIFPFKVSSAVRILPDTRPHAGIDPKTAQLETVPTM